MKYLPNYKYSAPLSVIFIGREGILYGKPALSVALFERVILTLHEQGKIDPFFNPIINTVMKVLKTYLKKKNIPIDTFPPFSYILPSNYSYEVCQTPLSVALISSLLDFYTGKWPSLEAVQAISFTVEKKMHPYSSGISSATSCFGGLIYFRKEFEFLKAVYSLPIKFPSSFIEALSLVSVKSPNISSELKYSSVSSYLEHIEKIVKRIIISITKEDKKYFISTLNEYTRLLYEMNKTYTKDRIFSVVDKKNQTFLAYDTAGDSFNISYEGVKKELRLAKSGE